ncbi:hypothetical protein FV139_19360 [Parahaliea maris]|uniref:Aspartyl protease n=1 Tax=Parahaliea maris TaxID=2716870 RepID=A0A5C8ZN06_9GAMM|nr:retropepsin-like aspartic protease [Parahaliea maris]TXS89886.1 hypothetical protein FV139_19360 [Parahaliea maris]
MNRHPLPGSPQPGDTKASRAVRHWLVLAASLLSLSLPVLSLPAQALDFPVEIPLEPSGGGTLMVTAEVGGASAQFLLDTGAGMATISRDLFEQLQDRGALRAVRRVALRLADNRIEPVQVYSVEEFRLGATCDLGPLELAVMDRGGRNLLGLTALGRSGPFAVDAASQTLLLRHCAEGSLLAQQ